MTDANPDPVESHGDPIIGSRPISLPCKGPACDEWIRTHHTDADIEAAPNLQVLRYTPETDDERLVRYWFCSPECRAAFVEAAESGEREETLYDETPNADQQEKRNR